MSPSYENFYLKGLYWILRERAGQGGWPPRNVERVSGWLCTRMLADMCDKPVRLVARDLIDAWAVRGGNRQWP